MTSASPQTDLDGSLDDLETPPPTKPRITGTGIGLAALGWTLYALLYAFFIGYQRPDAPFVAVVLGQLVYVLILGGYSVPIWWITVREMDRLHWSKTLGVHLLLGPLYAWAGLESYLLLVRLLSGETPPEMVANYRWIMFGNLTVYAIQFAMYHLVRNVQRLREKERQASELLTVAREQQLAALKAQVNPHFLFNTLNSISATLKRDPDQAREMIAKLAGMMRYALDSADRDRVPLRDEVRFVRQYLALERHRFSDRLDAEVDVDVGEHTLDTLVPPMILQPLVENALRHGIAPSEDGGTVRVRVADREERLRVRVEDTGVGPDTPAPLSSESEGTGLANTSTRLERTYGPEAALHTDENTPTGFRVWFSLPRNGSVSR